MKLATILTLMLVSATAGCERHDTLLAQICRESARIEVHDAQEWNRYLTQVRMIVLENRKLAAKDLLAEKGIPQPPDKGYLIPFPYVDGYEVVSQHPRFSGLPQAGETPGPNDRWIRRAGKPIATIRDFDVTLTHFGYTEIGSCSRDHPEDYGLR